MSIRRADRIPRFLSTEPRPGDRGLTFGRTLRAAVSNTVTAYRGLFAALRGLTRDTVEDFGERVGVALAAEYPELVDEIEGIATGSGVSALELLAVNARTELLAGFAPAECSVVGVLPAISADASCLLAQNWDWHPNLTQSRVLWSVTASDRWFVTLTEAGILAKIGLNDRHLGCALSFLSSKHDGGSGGIPVHILLRMLLEHCGDVRAAASLLVDAPVRASASIVVAHGPPQDRGTLFAAELSPCGNSLVWPDEMGLLVHTNHFLASSSTGHDTGVVRWPGSLRRRQSLENALLALARRRKIGPQDLTHVLSSHQPEGEPVCRHVAHRALQLDDSATLASVVMRLRDLSLLLAEGPPCSFAYDDVRLPRK